VFTARDEGRWRLNWTVVGAVLALLGVAAGAFGAHALRSMVDPARIETFEVAVRYQMFHAIAVLLAGMLGAPAAGWCFLAGVVVFSGSLYLLVLTGARWLGAVTPVGGVLFLLGWVLLAFEARK
jgi:uncharacterized membrane protein YgdD (TMEM256/DUF423 family)